MNRSRFCEKIDSVIRFFLFLLIFWLPYSQAVVESCVILSFVLWLVKRFLSVDFGILAGSSFYERAKNFLLYFKPPSSFLNKQIYVFLFICLISAVLGVFPLRSLHGFITKTFEWFVVYFLVLEVFTQKRHIQTALAIFVITSLATILDGFIQFYFTQKDIFNGREITRGGATAGFNHANGLGGYLTFVVPVFFSLVWLKKTKFIKVKTIFIFLLSLWVLGLTLSRGAWLGIFIGLCFYLFSIRRKSFFWVTISFLILIIWFYFVPGFDIIQKLRLSLVDIKDTFAWRLRLWSDVFDLIKLRPFFGYGLNSFMMLFYDYGSVLNRATIYTHPTYAHNCVVQMIFENGVLGFVSFVLILKSLVLTIYRKIRCWQDTKVHFVILLIGFWSGIIAFLVQSFMDTNLYSLQLSVLFWLMVGVSVCVYRLIDDGADDDMAKEDLKK